MALNAENARIFGSDDDTVSIAPLDSTLPTTLGALDAAFDDVGWLGPDGLTFAPSDNVAQLRGFQGGKVVRTVISESGTSFTFQCLESTALTHGLQWQVESTATVGGVTTTTMSSGRTVEARAFVLDLYDRDDTTIHHRYVIERGEIGARESVAVGNSDIVAYSFTVEIIGDIIHITNDPAYVVES